MSGKDERDLFDGRRLGQIDDAVFTVMSDRHRRVALYFLLEYERMTLAELADVVTGWTAARRNGMATREERARVSSALYHHHVPEMVDAGLVDYDAATETVALAPLPDDVLELVEQTREYENHERRDAS